MAPILIEDSVKAHLTCPEGEAVAEMRARTLPGMAFWIGTGPDGLTCRECRFWGRGKRFKRDHNHVLRDRPCQKYRHLTMGATPPGSLPYGTASCKYFEANEKAPPIEPLPRKKKGDAA